MADLTFTTWLRGFRPGNDAIGDFVRDARRDRELAAVSSPSDLANHLRDRGACEEAVETATKAWRLYATHTGGQCDG